MEVYALKYLESRFTPKLYDVMMDKDRIYMVQERAGKRTLKSFVNKYKAKITVGFYSKEMGDRYYMKIKNLVG